MRSSATLASFKILLIGGLFFNVSSSQAQVFYGGFTTDLYQIVIAGDSCTWTYIGEFHTAAGVYLWNQGTTTCSDGTMYMINSGDLYIVDPSTAVVTLLIDGPFSSNIGNPACGGGGIIYAQNTASGELVMYDLNTGTVTSLPGSPFGEGMVYINGYLYLETQDGLVQIDPCNPSNYSLLFPLPQFSMGLSVVPGMPNTLLVGGVGSLSFVDLNTGASTFLCTTPVYAIQHLTAVPDPQPPAVCPPTIDLDANDSSGAPGPHFISSPFSCLTPGGVPVADVDASIISIISLGQMTLTMTGIQDPGEEALVLNGSFPGISVTGSGTATLTLTNTGGATIADFLAALLAIVYQNYDPSPTPGLRQVTITVANGSGTSNPAIAFIQVVNSLSLSGVVTGNTNCTPPNGGIDLTVFPAGSYTYAWSDGATTEDLEDLAPGNYSVTVDTGTGCTATDSFEVDDQAVPPTLSLLVTASLCGQADGSVDLSITGGVSPYTFNWSSGATTEDLTNLAAGSYTVTVTGGNGCTTSAPVNVPNNNISISISGSVQPNTSCVSTNGGIGIALSPATPPTGSYVFGWSNGATAQNLSNLAPGLYSLTVSVGSACSATASFTVADEPLLPLPSIAVSPSHCALPDGSLDLSLSNGADPFTFLWSNGSSAEDLISLMAGTYTVTVTGGNGCTASADAVVPNNDITINIAGSVAPNTLCQQLGGNGSVVVNLSPPSPPGGYLFIWSTGAATQNISDLLPGTYALTVLSGLVCSADASFTVTDESSTPQLSSAVTAATCGQGNGSIDLGVTGGTAPYTFLWLNPDSFVVGTMEDLAGIVAGMYSVTVTEANGCTASAGFSVPDNSFSINASLSAQTACWPPNGSVDLAVTPPGSYTYSWSNGALSEDINELPAGSYTVTVGGAGACTASADYVVADSLPPPDTMYIFGTNCDIGQTGIFEEILTNANGCDSVIISNISYSTADTTYIFGTNCDIGQTGIFEETLANMNGCDSVVITNISFSAADTTLLFGTNCDVNQVGIFEELLQNINGCDSLIITNIAYSTADTTLLFGTHCDIAQTGIFEETLINSNGCDSLIITNIAYSAADTTLLFGTNCDIAQTGIFEEILQNSIGCDSIVITNISYSAADTTLLFGTNCDIAQTGIFGETLTNSNGCDSVIITNIAYSAADTTLLFGTHCDIAQTGIFEETLTSSNGCDSLVITNISYSVADTTYLFSSSCDPSQTGIFEELLQNMNGCDSLVISNISYSAADTTLVLDTNCDIAQTGIFEATYTNQSGCDSTVITTVSLLESDTTVIASATCNPTQAGSFTEIFSNQFGCDSTVITTVSLLESDTTVIASATCDPAQVGIFTEVISNQNGCDSTIITSVSLLQSDTTFLSGETCDPTQAGSFTETFSNHNGCDSTVITTISLLPSDSTSLSGDTCDPTQTGSFTEVFSNQNGCDSIVTTTVSLLESDTTVIVSATCDLTQVGIFTETFSNQSGCDSVVVETVVLLPAPVLSTSISDFNSFGVSCEGASDGSATVAVDGVNGPFSYIWSNGATGPQVDDLSAGSYAVTVTTAEGCTAVAGVSITAPPPLTAAFSVTPLDCFGENGGAIFMQASGGAPPYQYSLNGGAFQPSDAFTGLSAGTYEAVVQDANGCESSEIIWINAPVPVEVDLGDDLFIGLGESTSIHAVVNLPIELLANVTWTGLDSAECPGCLDQPLAPVLTSAYSVSIVDVNGCGDEDAVTVFVDRRKGIFVPNAFSPNSDGVNDLFRIFAKPGTVKNIRSFLVFDRWGESVWQYYNFQPDDPAYGWDGTHREEEMDPAVFIWFAEIEFTDGEVGVFEGEVVLVR